MEPILLFKTPTGKVLPTKAYDTYLAEAQQLGAAHVEALNTQVHRQMGAL